MLKKIAQGFDFVGKLIVCSYLTCPYLFAAPLFMTQEGFPENLDRFNFVEYRHGCGGGVSIIESEGVKYALKAAENPKYMEREALTNYLYLQQGVAAPNFALYRSIGELANNPQIQEHVPVGTTLFMLSQFIEGSNMASVTSSQQKGEILSNLRRGFVVDTFLSNWDLHGDNVRLNKDLFPVRVDNGNGLDTHATGGWKTASDNWDSTTVSDIRTMRAGQYKHDYYDGFTQDELSVQISELLTHKSKTLSGILTFGRTVGMDDYESLYNKTLKRFEYLELLQSRSSVAIADPDELVGLSAAGTFITTTINGVKHTLLAKRAGNGSWCNPGGKSDPQDQFLYDSAARETREETHGKIRITAEALRDLPSHDLLPDYFSNPEDKDVRYRMYFADHPFVDPAELVFKSKNNNDAELTEFKWVPTALLVRPSEKITLEDGTELELYASLHRMLNQAPVVDIVDRITKSKRLEPRHTQGLENPNSTTNALDMGLVKVKWVNPISYEKMADSWGQSIGHRTLTNMTDASVVHTQQMFGNPHLDSWQIARSTLAHSKFMVKIKSTDVSKVLKKKTQETSVEEVKAQPTFTEEKKTQPEAKLCATDRHMEKKLGVKYSPVVIGSENEAEITRKNIKAVLTGTTDEKVLDQYVEMVMNERRHPGSIVSYHATAPEVAASADFFTGMRQALSMIYNPRVKFLRGIDSAFSRYPTVAEFMAAFRDDKGHINNYEDTPENGRYTEMGLSVVPWLTGGPTTDYYQRGSSAAVFYGQSLMNTLMAFLGGSISNEQWHQVFGPYLKRGETNNGAIYQMFMPTDLARTLSYIAVSGGTEAVFGEGEDEASTPDPLLVLKDKPEEFWKSLKKAQKRSHKLSGKEKEIKPDDLQMRHYMRPDVWSQVEVFEHRLHPIDQRSIQRLIDRQLVQVLFGHREIPETTFYKPSGDSTPDPLALVKFHRDIFKRVTGEELKDRPISPDMLAEFIDKGNIDGIRMILAKYPYLDLSKPIKLAGGKGKSGEEGEKKPLQIIYDVSIVSEAGSIDYSEIAMEIIDRISRKEKMSEFIRSYPEAKYQVVYFAIAGRNENHLEKVAKYDLKVSAQTVLRAISSVSDRVVGEVNPEDAKFFEKALETLSRENTPRKVKKGMRVPFQAGGMEMTPAYDVAGIGPLSGAMEMTPACSAAETGNLNAFLFLADTASRFGYGGMSIRTHPGLNILHFIPGLFIEDTAPQGMEAVLGWLRSVDEETLVHWISSSYDSTPDSTNSQLSRITNLTPIMQVGFGSDYSLFLWNIIKRNNWIGLECPHGSILHGLATTVFEEEEDFSKTEAALAEIPSSVMKGLLTKPVLSGWSYSQGNTTPTFILPVLSLQGSDIEGKFGWDIVLNLSLSNDFAGILDAAGSTSELEKVLDEGHYSGNRIARILSIIRENPTKFDFKKIVGTPSRISKLVGTSDLSVEIRKFLIRFVLQDADLLKSNESFGLDNALGNSYDLKRFELLDAFLDVLEELNYPDCPWGMNVFHAISYLDFSTIPPDTVTRIRGMSEKKKYLSQKQGSSTPIDKASRSTTLTLGTACFLLDLAVENEFAGLLESGEVFRSICSSDNAEKLAFKTKLFEVITKNPTVFNNTRFLYDLMGPFSDFLKNPLVNDALKKSVIPVWLRHKVSSGKEVFERFLMLECLPVEEYKGVILDALSLLSAREDLDKDAFIEYTFSSLRFLFNVIEMGSSESDQMAFSSSIGRVINHLSPRVSGGQKTIDVATMQDFISGLNRVAPLTDYRNPVRVLVKRVFDVLRNSVNPDEAALALINWYTDDSIGEVYKSQGDSAIEDSLISFLYSRRLSENPYQQVVLRILTTPIITSTNSMAVGFINHVIKNCQTFRQEAIRDLPVGVSLKLIAHNDYWIRNDFCQTVINSGLSDSPYAVNAHLTLRALNNTSLRRSGLDIDKVISFLKKLAESNQELLEHETLGLPNLAQNLDREYNRVRKSLGEIIPFSRIKNKGFWVELAKNTSDERCEDYFQWIKASDIDLAVRTVGNKYAHLLTPDEARPFLTDSTPVSYDGKTVESRFLFTAKLQKSPLNSENRRLVLKNVSDMGDLKSDMKCYVHYDTLKGMILDGQAIEVYEIYPQLRSVLLSTFNSLLGSDGFYRHEANSNKLGIEKDLIEILKKLSHENPEVLDGGWNQTGLSQFLTSSEVVKALRDIIPFSRIRSKSDFLPRTLEVNRKLVCEWMFESDPHSTIYYYTFDAVQLLERDQIVAFLKDETPFKTLNEVLPFRIFLTRIFMRDKMNFLVKLSKTHPDVIPVLRKNYADDKEPRRYKSEYLEDDAKSIFLGEG